VAIRYLYKAIRRLFFPSRLRGLRNISAEGPVIVVANHAGSFGPVSVITSVPKRMHPWVSHEVTDLRTVAGRIQAEFLEQELHLRPPLSAWLARLIGRICVALMKDIGAIPVYSQSKRIRSTVQESLRLMEEGKNILVFAEDSKIPLNEAICEFCTGFIHLAKLYYEKTRKAVQFIPVAVNRKVRGILVGAPIRFDAENPFPREKERLKRELENTVYTLYQQLEHDPELMRAAGLK
jgi:1-acyl-sn-glycerol-3-phosphate acyltransferase